MFEYLLINVYDHTEERIVFGYSYKDACRRHKCNPNDWTIIRADYVD